MEKQRYSKDKLEEMVLAMLYLRTFQGERGLRAWKSMDWDAMDRLYEKGLISNPKNLSSSIEWTDKGLKRAKASFEEYLGDGATTHRADQ